MTTKTLKASSGRPLPVHVSQHGSILWRTLHPKPRSHVMSDLCLLWTPCALVFVSWCIYTAVLTHTCVLPTKPRPDQSSLEAIPSGLCRWEFVMVPFKVFIFPPSNSSPSAWAKLSSWWLGLELFPAYADFLGRGWVSESVGIEVLLHFRRRRNLPLLELQL